MGRYLIAIITIILLIGVYVVSTEFTFDDMDMVGNDIYNVSILNVTDRINVSFVSDQKLEHYLLNFKNYITNEILADTLFNGNNKEGFMEDLSIGEYNCKITISKVV